MNAVTKAMFFMLALGWAISSSAATNPANQISLRKAKGVTVALYDENTGTRYAKIHYEKFSKRPSRIGFLKVGLPILTFHELSLHLDARHADARSLLSAIEKMANARSARYLHGENVAMTITQGKLGPIKLQAMKAKFCATGLHFFGEVELSLPGKETPIRCESLYLRADQETNALTLVTAMGNDFDPIPLGDDSKLVSESNSASIKTQRR